jgi:hypothetical protein
MSNKQMDALKKLQEQERKLKLVACVVTRWCSLFLLFQRLLRLRLPLERFYLGLAASETAIYNKQFKQWAALAQVLAVLKGVSALAILLQRQDLCMGEAWYHIVTVYVALDGPFEVQNVNPGAQPGSVTSTPLQAMCPEAVAVCERLRAELEARFIMQQLPPAALAAIFLDPVAGNTVLTALTSIQQVSLAS